MDIVTSLIGGGGVAAILVFLQYIINRNDTKKDKKDGLAASIADLAGKIDALEARIDRRDTDNARRAILRFGDEIYNGVHHSKEMFEQILDDTDKYEKFCEKNPDYENSKTVQSVQLIRETYYKLYSEHKF